MSLMMKSDAGLVNPQSPLISDETTTVRLFRHTIEPTDIYRATPRVLQAEATINRLPAAD